MGCHKNLLEIPVISKVSQHRWKIITIIVNSKHFKLVMITRMITLGTKFWWGAPTLPGNLSSASAINFQVSSSTWNSKLEVLMRPTHCQTTFFKCHQVSSSTWNLKLEVLRRHIVSSSFSTWIFKFWNCHETFFWSAIKSESYNHQHLNSYFQLKLQILKQWKCNT